MSLTKRLQERDEKLAAEKARAAEEKKLQNLATHPLVKNGCARDVRDAYFYGIVAVAFANDDELDDHERGGLDEIGKSLNLSKQDVDDAVSLVRSIYDDLNKMESLIQESVQAIKDNECVVKLFYAQFLQLWSYGHEEDADPSDLFDKITELTGVALPKGKKCEISKVVEGGESVDESLEALAEWMGEDTLKYFVVKQYGDVTDRLNKVRKRKILERKKKIEQKRVEDVRKDFHDKVMELSQQYASSYSVPRDWREKFKELFDEINDDDIDWVAECNSVFSALKKCERDLKFGYVKYGYVRIAWRLHCMLFVHSGEVGPNVPANWNRSISNTYPSAFVRKVKHFLEESFDVEIS